jgi:DNA polymerase-3 subunit epsilon/CBS domain-containing protein
MAGTAPSTPLQALDAVVLDTETTGLDARTARVVQIGMVRLGTGEASGGPAHGTSRYETLVAPGLPMPRAAAAVHGITDAKLAGARPFPQLASEFEAFIGSAIVVGHAIDYDIAVLRREYERAGRRWPGWRALDVRALGRVAAPTLADHGLDRLCEWLQIRIEGRHSAMGDAVATAAAFQALLPLLRQQDVRTLAEAEAAIRALGERDAAPALAGSRTDAGTQAPPRRSIQIDSFPYRHRVRDVMSAPALTAPAPASVGEAIRLLLERRVSSVLVTAEAGRTGIVTERDLLREIDANGAAGLATPLATIMRSPLQTVAADAFIYRAIGRMERLGIRHLGVHDADGRIAGMVTTRNLLRHRSTTSIVLGDAIDSAADSRALAAAWADLVPMAETLMGEAVDPMTISAVVSAEICHMTRRAAELAEAQMQAGGLGPPPVPYAVLVLGSAGRGESQLAADQDNAIVYASGAEGGPEDRYFATLAGHMNTTLDEAGVPLCKGGVMAKNRAWRQGVADWKATIERWVGRQRSEDLLNVDIFFDAVPVHGDAQLAEEIWQHAFTAGHRTVAFQKLLTESARHRASPFTLLGGFRVDTGQRIDLKKFGLMPLFTAARVLAIRHDVRERGTWDRLEGVLAKGIGTAEGMQTLREAHRTILRAVIGQQLADAHAGVPLSPRVAAARLDKTERAALKQALAAVDDVLDLVSEGRV